MKYSALVALFLYICSGITDAAAQTPEGKPTIAKVEEKHDSRMEKLWYASMAFEAGGSAFDAVSSWHKQEANPLLASNGIFSSKAIGIKLGLTAATIVPQLMLSKNKSLRKGFMLMNFAEAGVYSGVAVHNLGRTAPK